MCPFLFVSVLQGLSDRDPVLFDSDLQWTLRSSLRAIPSLMLLSASVAPLPPGFHKLLSVTVTSFAVFPSWMYLLGGDDNCVFSVPSSTWDLSISCWEGGDTCQMIAAASFTLFNYEL